MCSTFFITALIAALVSPFSQAPVQAAEMNHPDLDAPGEVWVDDNYTSGGTNDGHDWGVNAFATIQDGVNAAAAGGTVHVGPGTYVEDVQLNKSLHLVGDPGDAGPGPGPNAPTIGGCPTQIQFCNGITFILDTSNFSDVLIEGFIIRDHPRNTADLGDSTGGFGIRIKNQYNATMRNLVIKDNDFIDNRWEALMFFSMGNLNQMYFENVEASRNRVLNTSAMNGLNDSVGIECTNCRNSLIQGNVIQKYVAKGIWIVSESQGTLNPAFTNGQGVVVTGNTIEGATLAAIDIDSYDSNYTSPGSDPILSGVLVTNNNLNRITSDLVGSQTSNLVRIHHQTPNAAVNNITVSTNILDHSYAQQAAISAVDASQISIIGNSISAASELVSDQGVIYLFNTGSSNTVSGNTITLASGLYTANNGIYLAGPNSGNFAITQNTLAASGMSKAAIRLGASFNGSAGSSVEISSNRITGFTNSLVFESTSDAHSISVRYNAMNDNYFHNYEQISPPYPIGGAISNRTSPVDAVDNWWGCNAGSNHAGCDATTGLFNADPWLVLSFSPEISVLSPGASTSLNANLLMNSAGQDKSGQGFAAPNITAAFSGTSGDFSPNPSDLLNGAAATTYTAPLAPGIVQLCTAVDGETVCRTIRVGNAFIFLPAVLR